MSDTLKPTKRRDGQIQCRNCPVWFTPRLKGGSPQLFHSEACRKQWNHNGAAFGKLRDKLPEFIEKEVRRQMAEPLTKRIDILERLMENLRADYETLRAEFNVVAEGLDAPRIGR